jgi:hypothetical protein
MKEAPNIAELAVAAWRLERWLDNLNAERKMAAKKSLREIKKYIEALEIEIVDPLGWRFDPGLAVEVVNNEAEDVAEEELIIVQTNSPIIKQAGAVIQYGKIILGQDIKEQKSNNEIKSAPEPVSNSTPEADSIPIEKETEAVLKQSKLFVSPDNSYWLRSFDCKAVKNDEQAVIVIDSNVDVGILLMDEKAYSDYRKGIYPMNPFNYAPKSGSCYITLPYPDIWYIVACPPVGRKCNGYYFDMNCEWRKKELIQREAESSKSQVATQPENTKEVLTAYTESMGGQDSVDCSADGDSPITVDIAGTSEVPQAESTDDKKIPDLTDKAFEKLRKNNISSLYKHKAMDRGLFEPHGKKKR